MSNDKSAEEIVLALRICNRSKGHRCSECPVFSQYEHGVCKRTVDRAAAGLIESQAAEIAELRGRVSELEAKLERAGEEYAYKQCECDYHYGESMDYKHRLEQVEARLTASQQEKWAAVEAINRIVDSLGGNRPLTLDELRGMDGEPVWVATMKEWRTVYIGIENDVRLYSIRNTISARHVLDNGGRIYRRKPEPEGGDPHAQK